MEMRGAAGVREHQKACLQDAPFIRSKARGTSYFLALMKRTSRLSGFSPNVSWTALLRSSPASAFSFIIPRSSFTAASLFSSVSFSSSLACKGSHSGQLTPGFAVFSSLSIGGHLLLGVVRQAGAGSKDRSVVLDSEPLQLGPEGLLLLRHHTIGPTLKKTKDSDDGKTGEVLRWSCQGRRPAAAWPSIN